MPEGFDSSDDRDTSTASDDDSEWEGPLGSISPSRRDGFGHEALDLDDEMSVDGPECAHQELAHQMDNHNPVASTSKAAVSGPMSRVQYTAGRRTRKRERIPNIPIDPDVNCILPEPQEKSVDPEPIYTSIQTSSPLEKYL